jgi:hypothetical protein
MTHKKNKKTHFIWHSEWKKKLCIVNFTGGVIETLCLILSKETKMLHSNKIIMLPFSQ